MDPFDRQAMAALLNVKTFELLDFALKEEAEALAAGKKREAISWRSRAKQIEKSISRYGLKRPLKP